MFRLNPGLKKAYEETVPTQLSEKDFFLKVVQAHRVHGRISGLDDAVEAQTEGPPSGPLPYQTQQKPPRSAATDLESTDAEIYEGYGTFRGQKASTKEKRGTRILRGLNTDSEQILRCVFAISKAFVETFFSPYSGQNRAVNTSDLRD